MAYWNDEEPQVKRVAGMELRYYPQAGKLQIYQQKEGSTHGVSKGIVVELAKQDAYGLVDLLVSIEGFFYDSVSEQVEIEAWDQLIKEAHEA